MSEKITGAEAMLRAIEAEGVDTIFGYPGGAIIPVFDRLYDHDSKLKHILVRHEQGATHAAQGYARVSGKTGVVIVTSGPGATNAITGISDAMMDSTPMVVIMGQVASESLGSDAFQETDVIGITQPVTKWSHQIRTADEIAWAVSRAFYIASTGRPGPVVLDFAKNAQNGLVEWNDDYQKCKFIRIEIYEYTPMQVKQSVVGYGKATKAQVMHMVGAILNLQNTPKLDDTCDALAIAICHAHTGGSRLKEFYNLK